jgi:outer membrane immunogenic protein
MEGTVNIIRNTALTLIAAVGIGCANLAFAADLSRPPPPAPAPAYIPPAFSWTGFYFGGNLGGAWSSRNVTDTLTGVNFNTGNSNGAFVGGGQVGFNYQFSNIVVGLEGDFDWASNNNSTNGVIIGAPLGLGHTFAASVNNGWITLFTGRLGVAFDHVLLYGKGGGAWVGNSGLTVTDLTTGTSLSGSANNSNSGWTVGAGVEWAFTNNWTVKAEYDYVGLSSRTFTVPAGLILAGDTFTATRNINMFTVGVNYLFSWGGPVVARY